MDERSTNNAERRPVRNASIKAVFSPIERADRYDCSMPTTAKGRGFSIDCLMVNISFGGAAFRTKNPTGIKMDDHVELDVQSFVKLTGRVRWVGKAAFGVQFDDASQNNNQVRAYVERLAARTG